METPSISMAAKFASKNDPTIVECEVIENGVVTHVFVNVIENGVVTHVFVNGEQVWSLATNAFI